MTHIILYFVLWLWDNRSFDKVGQSNRDKTDAESAYLAGNYLRAADLYRQITYGSVFSEPASRLYLAHCYFRLDSLQRARHEYSLLLRVDDHQITSRANTQLAVLANTNQDTVQALSLLMTALRQDPENDVARFDFELLKKTFSGRLPASPPPPAAPPQALAAPEQREVELARQRRDLLDQLRKLNMSEEQARSILEAMKSNEAQYTYQLRRGQYFNQSEQSKVIEW